MNVDADHQYKGQSKEGVGGKFSLLKKSTFKLLGKLNWSQS